jgi:hypothetical protein
MSSSPTLEELFKTFESSICKKIDDAVKPIGDGIDQLSEGQKQLAAEQKQLATGLKEQKQTIAIGSDSNVLNMNCQKSKSN